MQLRKWISITLCSLMLCACAGKAAEHSSECPADMYPLHSEIKFETGDLESGTYTPAVDIKLAGNSGECIDAGVEIKPLGAAYNAEREYILGEEEEAVYE